MLGNLDNEVIFKKAFTNKTVFKAFVKDVLGIEVEIDKIETEKKFDPPIGYIDFEPVCFAETIDKKAIIKIQSIEDDHDFNILLHSFLRSITQQQKSANAYSAKQTVYVINLLMSPYNIKQKNGETIQEEVLVIDINPQTLNGVVRDLGAHQFVCLNPNHPKQDTPQRIRDWLDLIYQSIHSPERPRLNTQNEGIRKAIELISFENLTPQERAQAENKEEAQIGRLTSMESAKNGIKKGYDDAVIADITGLSIAEIQQLRTNTDSEK